MHPTYPILIPTSPQRTHLACSLASSFKVTELREPGSSLAATKSTPRTPWIGSQAALFIVRCAVSRQLFSPTRPWFGGSNVGLERHSIQLQHAGRRLRRKPSHHKRAPRRLSKAFSRCLDVVGRGAETERRPHQLKLDNPAMMLSGSLMSRPKDHSGLVKSGSLGTIVA